MTNTDPWVSPSEVPSAQYKPSEHIGKLVLFKPTGTDDAFTYGGKAKKPQEVVFADVVVINEDTPAESMEFTKSAIGPWGIRRLLLPHINKSLVFGRVQKHPDPSANESGAYYVEDATAEEKKLGEAYLASKRPTL